MGKFIISTRNRLSGPAPQRTSPLAPLSNQRGIALILALTMLVILSLLGALALTVSTTDVQISGNLKNSQNSFFAAEAAIEYAMGNEAITQTPGITITDLNAGAHPANLSMGGIKLDPNAVNQVVSLGAGELPDGLSSKFGQEKFGGAYYTISVTGVGINERSQTKIEAEQVRIYQKDDEGILTSTEGG